MSALPPEADMLIVAINVQAEMEGYNCLIAFLIWSRGSAPDDLRPTRHPKPRPDAH